MYMLSSYMEKWLFGSLTNINNKHVSSIQIRQTINTIELKTCDGNIVIHVYFLSKTVLKVCLF